MTSREMARREMARRTRLTRTGVLALLSGAVTVGIGRFFGVLELYVLGAGALTLPLAALLRVSTTSMVPAVQRDVHPDRVHAGDAAHVELEVQALRGTSELTFTEPVDRTGGATIGVAPMRRGEIVRATYRLPTTRRGPLSVGPLTTSTTDPFGLATRSRVAAPRTSILVYPRVDHVEAPRIGGAGPLGAHLARRSLATTAGAEFHSQRTYVPGDDLRRVNWRASARSADLVVRETSHDGRVLVHLVLDLVPASERWPDAAVADEAFERAVSTAASIAVSVAERSLPLRMELTDGSWFRGGAELLPQILEHLALITPDPDESPAGGRSDHDLLGVAVLVTADGPGRAAALRARVATATAATVVVDAGGRAPSAVADWFAVDGSDPVTFVEQWNRLVGERQPAWAS